MALDANRRPSCGLGVLKNIFHAASILRLVASCLSSSSQDPATCLSFPAAPMDHEHRGQLPARAAVVDSETFGAVPGFEVGDIDAPAVVSEAASGADIDAAFVEDSDRQ